MQTALAPEHHVPSPHPQTSLLPLAAPQSGAHQPNRPAVNLDTLLKQNQAQVRASTPDRSPFATAEMQIEPPRFFLGLRAAFLFNMALGVTGFVAYEIWTAIAH